jgi:hypothetical protein
MPHTNRDATKELRGKTFSPPDNKYWPQEVDYVVHTDDGKEEVRCHTRKMKNAVCNTFDLADVGAALGLSGYAPMEEENETERPRYPARTHKQP